jgi:uncharacterized membrane protein YeaQ/YmgE (transglycosylase-associated protein family)
LAFFGFIVFGTLIGAVVRMLAAERAGGWTGSMLSGASGALVSGSVGRVEGLRDSHDSGGFSVALIGAFVVVAVYNVLAARRTRAVAPQQTMKPR